jgi:hypothetical protein
VGQTHSRNNHHTGNHRQPHQRGAEGPRPFNPEPLLTRRHFISRPYSHRPTTTRTATISEVCGFTNHQRLTRPLTNSKSHNALKSTKSPRSFIFSQKRLTLYFTSGLNAGQQLQTKKEKNRIRMARTGPKSDKLGASETFGATLTQIREVSRSPTVTTVRYPSFTPVSAANVRRKLPLRQSPLRLLRWVARNTFSNRQQLLLRSQRQRVAHTKHKPSR